MGRLGDGTTSGNLLQGVHTVALGVESVHKMHLEETVRKESVRGGIEVERGVVFTFLYEFQRKESSARCEGKSS